MPSARNELMIRRDEGRWDTNAYSERECACEVVFGGWGGWSSGASRWVRRGTRCTAVDAPNLAHLLSLGEMGRATEMVYGTEHQIAPRDAKTSGILKISEVRVYAQGAR